MFKYLAFAFASLTVGMPARAEPESLFEDVAFDEAAATVLVEGDYGTAARYCGNRVVLTEEGPFFEAIQNPQLDAPCGYAGEIFEYKLSVEENLYIFKGSDDKWRLVIKVLSRTRYFKIEQTRASMDQPWGDVERILYSKAS